MRCVVWLCLECAGGVPDWLLLLLLLVLLLLRSRGDLLNLSPLPKLGRLHCGTLSFPFALLLLLFLLLPPSFWLIFHPIRFLAPTAAELGSVPGVLRLMRRFPENEDVNGEGCGVLLNIAVNVELNKTLLRVRRSSGVGGCP